jgi:drug/metabolite transporter (DMT)-like permease
MTEKTGLIEVHSAVFLFGLAGLFGKWITLSPIFIVLGRVFFASIALFVLLQISRKRIWIRPRINYLFLFIMGMLLAVHWITFFQSIQVSTVSIGLLSFSTYPMFTTLFEPIVTSEKFIKINLLFSAICILGIYLIVPQFDLADSGFKGVLWGLASGFTFSILTIMNRRFSQIYSSPVIAFYQDFYACLILAPFLFILRFELSGKNFILLAVLGIVCTAASHTLFIQGMKYIKAQTASIIHTLEPVYGIIFALILLREIPSLQTILGGVVILSAQMLILFSLQRPISSTH